MRRATKNLLKRLFFALHKVALRCGLHILPVHYYSSLPDILELEKTQELWARRSALPGIHMDVDEQAENLRKICRPFQAEYLGNKVYWQATARNRGSGYDFIEAQALHAVIRYFQPRKIIEVGSGVSTFCMLEALTRNEQETGRRANIQCIEPHPVEELLALKEITLIPAKVQAVPLDRFAALGENDLLFIDSSHTVKPGGDVNFLVLEVLPRLKKGVIVHFHDIYLPYDYQRDVLRTFLFWNETSLVRAFLTGNDRVKVLFCLSLLHYDRQDVLAEVFPEYDPQSDKKGLLTAETPLFGPKEKHFPSSLYLQIR